jgi:proteasome accessory factor B
MPSAKRPAKVQRWVDLITALLRRGSPVSFETLSHEVPAYSNARQSQEARMRMFERDKDELRELGVPIDTAPDEDGNPSLYVLKSRTFYLPYVSVSPTGQPNATPRRPHGPGYQALPLLAFTPDQLAMVIRAARRVQQMRHPALAADADSALRKLAHDVSFAGDHGREVTLPLPAHEDAQVLEALDGAVRRRKQVTFRYHSMERDVTAERTVHPYGLLFISGAWYLVARDVEAGAIRNFRVSRIADPAVNPLRAQTSDFTVPGDFDLWKRAESRRAWELGDDDAITVTVRFDRSSAYAAAGAEVGEPLPDGSRAFAVRRTEPFVRWLLSFGGAARPLSPKPVVQAWRALAEQTAALYGSRR